MLRSIIIVFLFFQLSADIALSQCFGSPGNPAAGTSNLGTLKKNVLRVNLYHRYSYSDSYFNGYTHSDFSLYDKAYYHFLGNLTAFGITDKFTIEAETGYFINKTIHYAQHLAPTLPEMIKKGYGFNQTILSGKFLILSDDKFPVKWSASTGIKIPLRINPQYHNNTQLPQDVQPSNMAWGIVLQSYLLKENSFRGLRYFMINRYEYNFRNNQNFLWGQALYNSFYLSKRLHFKKAWLTENWTGIFQLRHELRTHNYNYDLISPEVSASGSSLLYFTPQINYTAKEIWNFSLMFDVPLFQYYNKIQIGNKFAANVSITRDFVIKK